MEQGPEVPAPRKRRGKDERESAVETPGGLSAEGRLRRAGWRSGEAGFATSGNATNPRIGSGMKQAREVEEEQTVEVVRNHEGGTRSGGGSPFPKEATTWPPGVDSRERTTDGRAIFEGLVRWCGEVDRKR
jgi:hypothetical protein